MLFRSACLLAEDVDWNSRTICYSRAKLKSRGGMGIKPALIRFGAEIEAILKRRPAVGSLFPYLRTVRPGDRSTEFHQRCVGLGIQGVSLHSYRYAWAERALKCGYPERFAQQALGHNSKAVHHAYCALYNPKKLAFNEKKAESVSKLCVWLNQSIGFT